MPKKKAKQPAPTEALAALLASLSQPKRRSGKKTVLLREASQFLRRYRHQLAPLAVMVAVLVVGGSSVGVGLAPRTFAAAGVLLAVAAWVFTRQWLDRAAERGYAAVCLLVAGCWLAWVSAHGVGPGAVRVWLVAGLALGVPWWVHYQIRRPPPLAPADAAALEAAVEAGVADEDAISAEPTWPTPRPPADPAGPGPATAPAAEGQPTEPAAADPAPEPAAAGDLTRSALNAAVAVGLGQRGDRRQLTLSRPVSVLPSGAMTWEYLLPAGQPAKLWMAKRHEFASALAVPVEWLDLRRGDTEQHLAVWRAGSDPWGGDPPRSPLVLHPRRTNIWDPAGLGLDVRAVPVCLRFTEGTSCSVLVGGQRGAGKTNSAFNLLAHVLCDPMVRLWGADPKPDTKAIRAMAHRWIGSDPHAMIRMLEELVAEMHRKFAFLESIDQVSVDRNLAALYPDDLQVDVLYIDELASFTMSARRSDPDVDRIVQLLTELLQLGRAAAVFPILCTQRPAADVIPTMIRANVQVRWALRCDGYRSSNMVLGDDASAAGWNAANIAAVGVGILNDNGSFRSLRSYYLGDQAADMRQVIAPFARRLREDAGTLPSGAAAAPAVVPSAAGAGDCGDMVLRLLGGGEMGRAELVLGCAPRFAERTVADALSRLQRDPVRVVRTGRGRYALTGGSGLP